jgi:hypothetical protein
LYFCFLVISKSKARKPVVTVGDQEKWKNGPCRTGSYISAPNPDVKNGSREGREAT